MLASKYYGNNIILIIIIGKQIVMPLVGRMNALQRRKGLTENTAGGVKRSTKTKGPFNN
jgi:hypothetical protein